MKKFILLSIVLLSACVLTASTAPLETDAKSVDVTNIEVIRTSNAAIVSFTLHVGEKIVANNRSLIIDPVLQNSDGQVSLSPIVVRGAKSKVSNEDRAMQAAQLSAAAPYQTVNGGTVEYTVSIPWENWMQGSELVFNGINAGQGKVTKVNIGLVADNLLQGGIQAAPAVVSAPAPIVMAEVRPPVIETQVIQQQAVQPQPQVVQAPVYAVQSQPQVIYQAAPPAPVYDQGYVVQKPMTPVTGRDYSPTEGYYSTPQPSFAFGSIGDELSSRFTFVEPVADFHRARQASAMDVVFDYNMPLILGTGAAPAQNDVDRFIEMTREGALYVKFNRGSYAVSRELGENNRMLVDLISTIRVIDASPNTRIAQVVIVGFSSPDGTADENERMAMERAAVARDFLTANSNINPDLISVYNGSVDWTVLRQLVSDSNMPEKYNVLDIIDNTPAWDATRNNRNGRLAKLMALDGGKVYGYMREHFFQQLRQTGAYAKVYYENVR